MIDLIARAERLDADERAVRAAAFHLLLRDGAAGEAAIAELAGLPPDRAAAAALRLAAEGSVERAAGGITGAYGLTLRATGNRLTFAGDGAPRFTWCAWDAVGIPAALGRSASAEAACARCGAPVVVRLEAGVLCPDDAPRIFWADTDPEAPLEGT